MASQEEKVAEGVTEAPKDDAAEFSGAWDELKAKSEGQPAPAAGHQDDEAGGATQGEDEAGHGAAGEAGATPGTDADQASRGEISDDVLAGADPAVKALVESERKETQKAKNLARSNGGRLAQALNELSALKQNLPAKSGDAEAETTDEADGIEQLRKDYPEVADPLLKKMATLEDRIKTLTTSETVRAESAVVELLISQQEELLERHPDLPTIVADPRYDEWVKGQTPAIQRIVQDNAQAVVNASDAGLVFDLFKQEHGIGRPDPAAESAARKRASQLEGARSATGSQPGLRSDTPTGDGSYEDEWDKLKRDDERKQAIGRR